MPADAFTLSTKRSDFLTVNAALPLATPAHSPPVSLVMEYVIFVAGVTTRWSVRAVTSLSTRPSDQVISKGPSPVSVTVIVCIWPAGIVPPPVTVAVGTGMEAQVGGVNPPSSGLLFG